MFAIVEPRKDTGEVRRRVEHYWLCGHCSCEFTLKQEGEAVFLMGRSSKFVSNSNENHGH
jgi:hypothetical protein